MTGKYTTERNVRQYANFKCENCDDFATAQYAHIIPESDGGEYEFNNLIFLCYGCHKSLEPAMVSGLLKKARIERMKEVKKRPKIDSIVDGLFELLPSKKLIVRMGEGIEFINTPIIFQEDPQRFDNPSFLKFGVEEGLLQIDGLFKDENARPIVEFKGGNFRLFTGDVWDILRKPGKLDIRNSSKKMRLILKQNPDLSVSLTSSNLYVGGHPMKIKPKTLKYNQLIMSGNVFENCLGGILIS